VNAFACPGIISHGRAPSETKGIKTMHKRRNLWSIILAGGNGQRLKSFVRSLFGGERPKQYCAFVGTRTMFQHTLDRASLLGWPEHKVTVVAKSHVERGWVGRRYLPEGKLIAQPSSRDTGPGVFLSLAYVRKQDPDASVVILPSDHYVYPESLFIQRIRNAAEVAEAIPDRPVLLGAFPKKPDADLGWIELGESLCSPRGLVVYGVSRFVEKPATNEAERVMKSGGLLNTLVIVSRLSALWALGRHHFPETIALLEDAAEAFDTDEEEAALQRIYQEMPCWNISADFLGRSAANLAVMELDGVHWSDWGKPERILETLHRAGQPPLFQMSNEEAFV
jgi:mannose-1-phosphate guanylyltransferase